MPIKYIVVILLLASCNNRTEQTTEDFVPPSDENPTGKLRNIKDVCGYNYDTTANEINISIPSTREMEEINSIISYSGLPQNFQIYTSDIKNAYALNVKNKRLIVFNKDLLSNLDKMSSTYWSSISILAHEVGHHLSGHTLSKNRDLTAELEADQFSGYVLYKMGASKAQATEAISRLASDNETQSHPSKKKRKEAIENGWDEAARQRYKSALPPPPDDDNNFFYEFTTEMLINSDFLATDSDWYSNQKYFLGIITEVDTDFKSFVIRVIKGGNGYIHEDQSINNTDFTVYIDDEAHFGNSTMCHACYMNFKSLIVPGRRLKMSMTEGCPGGGTMYNGVWFLTYAEVLKGSAL